MVIERLRSATFDGYCSGDPQGISVLFLHGWAGSKEIWLGFLKRCPPQFRFISIDIPGTGGTKPLESLNPSSLACWIESVADELGVQSFHLVGHSMGGNISAWTSSILTARVISLVMIAPALAGTDVLDGNPFISTWGNVSLRAASFGASILAAVDYVHPHKHSGGIWRSWFRRYRYVNEDNSAAQMLAQLRFLADNSFLMDHLPASLPVLIIHGAKDKTVPLRGSIDAASARPKNTKLLIYTDCMHCPMDDALNRTFKDLVQFLSTKSIGGPDVI